jgi:hypothetical protein
VEGGPTDSHLKDFQLISKFGLEKSLNKKSQTADQNSGNAEEYFVIKKNYACFFSVAFYLYGNKNIEKL